jgi:HNH endonuclease
MPARFNQKDVDDLLVRCHRRCCICHRFCGVKIETDHIVPAAEDGCGDIDNAIVVCFECHAEIHSYNDQHPRGRKFRPDELRKHKEQWLSVCSQKPEMLLQVSWDSDVGPLQALIDELEFNSIVADSSGVNDQGCAFLDDQFRRAIREGAVSTMKEDLKKAIWEAYAAIGRANRHVAAVVHGSREWPEASNKAGDSLVKAKPRIQAARQKLLEFLSSEK